jgi:hypothetical protein
MDGLRRAALVLSSLRADDRAWMLARVHDTERVRLAELVSEVRGLGLSLDAQTLRQFVHSDGSQLDLEADDARSSNIASASPGAVHEILGREPDWLIAIVLRARPWRWREAFLSLLGAERRRRVGSALPPGIEVRPRVIEALTSAISARLDKQAVNGWRESESSRMLPRLYEAIGGLVKNGGLWWRR